MSLRISGFQPSSSPGNGGELWCCLVLFVVRASTWECRISLGSVDGAGDAECWPEKGVPPLLASWFAGFGGGGGGVPRSICGSSDISVLRTY